MTTPVASIFHFEDKVIDDRSKLDNLTKRVPYTREQEQKRRNDARLRAGSKK